MMDVCHYEHSVKSQKCTINIEYVLVLTLNVAPRLAVHIKVMVCYKYNNMNRTSVTKQNYLSSVVWLLLITKVNPLNVVQRNAIQHYVYPNFAYTSK